MKISAPHIANLLEYASYRGISEEVLRNCLENKQLDVCNMENSVTENEFSKIFEELLALTKDNYFGLHYGCYLNIKALGFIAQLSLNASNIEQAVFILQNYFQSSFPLVSLKSELKKGQYLLKLECNIKNALLKSQILDIVYCFLYRELRIMVANEFLPVLELPYSRSSEYSAFLSSVIKRGKIHSFVFDSKVLEVELNKKKPKEIEMLLPKFLQMLGRKKYGYKLFSNQVREAVLNMCCPELPSFEQVTVHFPLSNRTIQRKLTGEGLSFRKITDEIKNELSIYLSKGNKMKTQDIAHILGYSEPSAYLHAVKKWRIAGYL